ncbi:MAG: CZB domain-containing protein [Magnetospirillum sp.]|nr:CZB domain-containing protein [Magnetospirillum sp.]
MTTDRAAAEAALDAIAAGRFAAVPAGTDPLSCKLKELAEALAARAGAELARGVTMSVNVDGAYTEMAGMQRNIAAIDRQSTAIAASAASVADSVAAIGATSRTAIAAARTAETAAAEGRAAADRAVATMQAIAVAVDEAAATVDGLVEVSTEIAGIVAEIETVARQTNLLALNATIEAIRAGVAGRGFGVVAGEVKQLAASTAATSADIRRRIDVLRHEMAAIVGAMQEGSRAVHDGSAVIATTGTGMHDLATQVAAVSARMDGVAVLLGRQVEASDEVSHGVAAIAAMTGRNVAAVAGVAAVMDHAGGLLASHLESMAGLEIADSVLYQAKADHGILRKRLALMLAGREPVRPEDLGDHAGCRLGRWCAGVADGVRANHPAFRRLEMPHRRFHEQAAAAARLSAAGDAAGAAAAMATVSAAAEEVLSCLEALIEQGR